MSTEFASAGLTAGQLNAIVKKLGGHEMALNFLRDELSVCASIRSRREEDEDGIIYFSVTSDGTSGEDWISRLEGSGFRIEHETKHLLRSADFRSTSGVTTEVAVLKGILFEDRDRTIQKIRAEADKRKLIVPSAELACLIRMKFTDKQIEAMGMWDIVVMHDPINNFHGNPCVLVAHRRNGGCALGDHTARPDSSYGGNHSIGFAFAVSQTSSVS